MTITIIVIITSITIKLLLLLLWLPALQLFTRRSGQARRDRARAAAAQAIL